MNMQEILEIVRRSMDRSSQIYHHPCAICGQEEWSFEIVWNSYYDRRFTCTACKHENYFKLPKNVAR